MAREWRLERENKWLLREDRDTRERENKWNIIANILEERESLNFDDFNCDVKSNKFQI